MHQLDRLKDEQLSASERKRRQLEEKLRKEAEERRRKKQILLQREEELEKVIGMSIAILYISCTLTCMHAVSIHMQCYAPTKWHWYTKLASNLETLCIECLLMRVS